MKINRNWLMVLAIAVLSAGGSSCTATMDEEMAEVTETSQVRIVSRATGTAEIGYPLTASDANASSRYRLRAVKAVTVTIE